VTFVPALKASVQSLGQVMPAGKEPKLPEPLTTVVSRWVGAGFAANVAVAVRVALMATVQVLVPVQTPPLQPEKLEPLCGVAVRVTEVPWG